VLLVFTDRSKDAWQAHGNETNPADLRRHDLSDAVAIPGLHANNRAWSGASTSDMTIGKDGGAQLVAGANLKLGVSASQALVRGNVYRSAEDTMLGLIKDALTAIQGAMPPAGGPMVSTDVHRAAVTAAMAAITTFQAAAASYLSSHQVE
jgi:hypothetical protein